MKRDYIKWFWLRDSLRVSIVGGTVIQDNPSVERYRDYIGCI